MDVEEVNRALHALRWKYRVTESEQRVHLNDYPEVRFPLSTGGRPDRGSEGWMRRKHRDGGMHEPATFAALIALSARLSPDGDVLDVGALYGYFSLLAASVLPRARVHAFEPNPASFRELQRNVEANPQLIPSRIHTLNAAVSDGRSRRAPVGLRGFSVVEGDDSGVHLEVTSIDHYGAEHDLRPSVVKIDVEGYQAKVLPGAMDLIARHRPALLIEFDEQQKLARFGVSNKDLVVPFGALGYRLLWCSNHRTVEEFREIPIEAMGPEQEQNSLGVFITG